MEHILKLDLDKNRVKPIIQITPKNEIVKCLIDSGADMPVWCSTEALLKSQFITKKLNRKTYIGGFGGGGAYHDVYSIDRFILADDNNTLAIYNLLVAFIPNVSFACDLILSASVFDKKIDYSICTRDSQRYIELRYDKEEYITLAKYKMETIDSVYIAATSDEIPKDSESGNINIQSKSKFTCSDLSANFIYTQLQQKHLDK